METRKTKEKHMIIGHKKHGNESVCKFAFKV